MCSKLRGFTIILVALVILQYVHANDEDSNDFVYYEDQELVEGTVDFCMYKYPYTYSKCAHLCHQNMDPVCVADSLCVCDSNINQIEYNGPNDKSWLHPETNCTKTLYCDISCREKSLQNQFFNRGYLCNRDSKSVCICTW